MVSEARRGAARVFSGLTKCASASSLDEARAVMRDGPGNVHFLLGTADSAASLDLRFDVVMFSWSLHHVPAVSRAAVLIHLGERLTPAGRLLIIEPTAEGEEGELFWCEGIDRLHVHNTGDVVICDQGNLDFSLGNIYSDPRQGTLKCVPVEFGANSIRLFGSSGNFFLKLLSDIAGAVGYHFIANEGHTTAREVLRDELLRD